MILNPPAELKQWMHYALCVFPSLCLALLFSMSTSVVRDKAVIAVTRPCLPLP